MLNPKAAPLQEPPRSTTGLRPLDAFPGSLAQKVYASLKEAILNLTIRPGEILRKAEICAALGVSRSPVAEAVARLASEALVDVIPQAGTFVARFSMAEIREGAFLREALELAAIELVATTVTDDQLVQLRRNIRLQEVLLADDDVTGFYAADTALHDMILSFTGHRRLPGMAATAWVHVNRARQLILPHPGRVADTIVEHKAIVTAVEARDPERARAATRQHLRQLVTLLEQLAKEGPELFS